MPDNDPSRDLDPPAQLYCAGCDVHVPTHHLRNVEEHMPVWWGGRRYCSVSCLPSEDSAHP
jgi:hypothetical protein